MNRHTQSGRARMVREGDWKLLANPDRSRMELYDVPSDPMELDDRSESEPDVRDDLFDDLLAWWRTHPDGPVSEFAGRNDYPWPGTATEYPYLAPPSNLRPPAAVFDERDLPERDG